jgi:hypothetical protein
MKNDVTRVIGGMSVLELRQSSSDFQKLPSKNVLKPFV